MLTENDILDILSTHLRNAGYSDIQLANTRQKGIDLRAKDPNGRTLLVEAKGETSSKERSKRFGKLFSGNQIWTHVSVALVKTLTTMNDHGEECVYGMAFPQNHGELVARLRTPLKKLGIVVYLVSKDGVEVMN